MMAESHVDPAAWGVFPFSITPATGKVKQTTAVVAALQVWATGKPNQFVFF